MKRTRLLMIASGMLLLVGGGWWNMNRAEPRVIQFAPASVTAVSGTFSYEPYAAALARYVNEQGMVNYRGLKTNSADLDAFAASLSSVKQEELDSWNDQRKIAFWMNARSEEHTSELQSPLNLV